MYLKVVDVGCRVLGLGLPEGCRSFVAWVFTKDVFKERCGLQVSRKLAFLGADLSGKSRRAFLSKVIYAVQGLGSGSC